MSYLPETVDMKVIDEMVRVSDRESFLMARRITREEGLLVGGSSGTAAVAAVKLAKTLPKDAIVVVLFPDSGRGYMSKVFNDEWMIANGFLSEGKRKATVGDVLRGKTPMPPMITVKPDDTVKTALDLLRKYEISQLPVMNGHEIVGSVNDVGVMQAVFDQSDILHKPVSEVMGRPFPALEQHDEIEKAYKLLTLANPAVVITDDGEPIGLLARQDIISFLLDTMKFSTRAIHVGQEADPTTGATIVPVYQTSTYTQDAVGEHKGFDYSRTINPTRLALEKQLASLEGGAHGYAFASGMAATAAVLNCPLPAITRLLPTISMAARTGSSPACSNATAFRSHTST